MQTFRVWYTCEYGMATKTIKAKTLEQAQEKANSIKGAEIILGVDKICV